MKIDMVDLSVDLGGLRLDNPIIPASGTFGFGYEFADIYDINILGSISLKGTTKEPRFGNPLPRIAECRGGMINSVGLQNPGVEKVISEEISRLKECFNNKSIANVGGFSLDEYAYNCERLGKIEEIGIIEVNISCPNVHSGGMSFGTDPDNAAEVTKRVKDVTDKPIFIKLTPNVTDITEIARACESAGADGLTLINTLMGMKIDIKTKKPVLKNKKGGFSGIAVFPVAVRMIYDVYEAVDIPIMGVGGVERAEDVIEMMLAGAAAVQVGAANLTEPYVCKNIIEELPSICKKYNIKNLRDIIGGAH